MYSQKIGSKMLGELFAKYLKYKNFKTLVKLTIYFRYVDNIFISEQLTLKSKKLLSKII